MFDALSFAEIDEQQAELLPARTVLSLFAAGGGGKGDGGRCNHTNLGLINVDALNNDQILSDVLNNVVSVVGVLGPNNSNSNC